MPWAELPAGQLSWRARPAVLVGREGVGNVCLPGTPMFLPTGQSYVQKTSFYVFADVEKTSTEEPE